MNYIGKFISNFKDAYNEINAATLTGAIDAVVVRQEDGSFVSSPFHVRFGKISVLRSREKVVDIEINGEPVDIHMKLGENGEAFFVEELADGDEVSPFLGTSPLPSFIHFDTKDDDIRSQDSGVEAEEIICKSLKVKSADEIDTIEVASTFVQTSGCDNGVSYQKTILECSSVITDEISQNIVSEIRIESRTSKENKEQSTQTVCPKSISPSASVDIPRSSYWREELVRSKSLTNELLPITKASCIVLEGQGSKTDVEEVAKITRGNRRKRKKRINNKKPRSIINESQSSENSTTSEMADLSSLSVSGAATGTHNAIFLMDDFDNTQEYVINSELKNYICNEKNWSAPMTRSFGPDFHPFSDTDISPPPSPNNSRPASPVKSDTEYEYEKQKAVLSENDPQMRDDKWSWTWGQLPTPPPATRSNSTTSRKGLIIDASKADDCDKRQAMTQQEEVDHQRSVLSSMFSFMRATKKARHNPESEGIYLDDLKLDELDPEVAALYFPRNSILLDSQNYAGFRPVTKDEDVESGNGTSLTQSPHSVEGAIGGPKMICDSDYDDSSRHPIFDYKGFDDLAFSLCGALYDHVDADFPESLFMQSLVTYDDFCENPHIIDDPNLVVRFGKKYMNWATASSQILSLALFQRPLPPKVMENIAKDNMPKKEMRKRTASKGYSWFSWGRNNEVSASDSAFIEGDTKTSMNEDADSSTTAAASVLDTERALVPVIEANLAVVAVKRHTELPLASLVSKNVDLVDEKGATDGSKLQKLKGDDSSESDDLDEVKKRFSAVAARFKKTMRLSSDQIKKLNLRNGSNEVVFSVTTAYQGTTRCKCHIFLWNYDEKIVVSDIDGTITKSDVLGHILPIIGKDWAQGGVAQLFTKIKNNGYNFLYLSARAIGQATITRDYLRSIKQGDVSLPDGPLLLNPTSLIHAFHREVIEKKPEEFKISCLRDIKALFPKDVNPFYAGYGNRINDVWAYSAVGVPISRIFTINHRGELKHELTQAFQTTYLGQIKFVDETFPPIERKMVPRDLLSFMYSEDEESEDGEGVVDFDYMDSDWEGFPTGIDAMSIGA